MSVILAVGMALAAAPRPHIISILQDDLGYADSGIHSTAAAAWTGNITALAKDGIGELVGSLSLARLSGLHGRHAVFRHAQYDPSQLWVP